jgi:hypothetical protein
MASLEGWNFTIKLCPRGFKLARSNAKAKRDFVRGKSPAELFDYLLGPCFFSFHRVATTP